MADENDEQPKTLLKFRATQKSPTLEIINGDYARTFDEKDQPFEAEPLEEAPMLLRSGYFVLDKEATKEAVAEQAAEQVDNATTSTADVGESGTAAPARRAPKAKATADATAAPQK
jgi:hypothetical protein